MIVSVHPGMVATAMAEKAGMLDGRFQRPMDDGELNCLLFALAAATDPTIFTGKSSSLPTSSCGWPVLPHASSAVESSGPTGTSMR